jgi:glycosidase
MEFHVSRAARQRYGVDASLFTVSGNVILPGFPATRRLAAAMNVARDPGAPPVQAGDLNAMGLVDEILHVVVALYRETRDREAMVGALATASEEVGEERLEAALRAFSDAFPALAVHRGEVDPVAYLDGSTDGIPNRAVVLEEMALLRLGNLNPAFGPFRELFDDRALAASTAYLEVVDAVADHFRAQPPFGPDGQALVEMLRAPAIASPDSLAGQLRFIRDRWGLLLGRYLDRLVVTLDVLSEEERAAWLRWMSAHGDGGGGADSAALRGFGAGSGAADEPERFSADREWMPRLVLMAKSTYVWLDQLSRAYGRDIRTLDAIPDEELDLLARRGITGLWLIGLWERSEASARIKRMMGNPEAVASAYSLRDYRIADDLGGEGAYADLRGRAWARGIRLASDMVPNHMGVDSTWVVEHPDRFLSLPEPPYPAYSFSGADLSPDDRVEIRIEDHYWDRSDAAVVFQRRDRWSGETRYIYHGNDGTSMPWNDTAQLDYLKADVREAVIATILDVARRFPVIRFDAAMTLAKKHVQRLWFPEPGHGGAIASRAEHAMTRAAFDAAMPEEFWREVVDRVAAEVPDTLLLAEAFWLMEGYFVRTLGMHRVYNSAFMHMLRDEDNAGYRLVMKNTLEFDPEILRRYVNFMNNPDEKTAVEQFGKGDKYFGVATLMATLPGLPMFGHGQVEGYAEKYGMEYRRAYHDETPDGWLVDRHEREIFPLLHRRWLFAEVRDFLLYDVTTPDGGVNEDVFAYSNRVGRERALVVYNNRYAEAHGRVRTSVGYAEKRADGAKTVVRRDLADGLGIRREDGWYTVMRDVVTGLEHIRPNRELADGGLEVRLGAYGRHVFLDMREVADGPAGQYGRLAARLGGAGVPSVEDALRELQLQPVHDAFRAMAAGDLLGRIVAAGSGRAGPEAAQEVPPMPAAPAGADDDTVLVAARSGGLRAESADRVAGFLAAVGAATGVDGDPAEVAARVGDEIGAVLRIRAMTGDAADGEPAGGEEPGDPQPARAAVATLLAAGDRPAWGTLLGYLATHRMGELASGADHARTSRAWFDELRLAGALAGVLRDVGLDESEAWRATDLARLLLRLPTVASLREQAAAPAQEPAAVPAPEAEGVGAAPVDAATGTAAATPGAASLSPDARALLAAWLADDDLRRFIRVNRWEGVAWFDRDAFEDLLGWAAVLDAIHAAASPDDPDVAAGRAAHARAAATAGELTAAAATAGYRLDGLREAAGA